ncbi:MAG: SCO1664 family protein [Acidimicrobiales bacterium]
MLKHGQVELKERIPWSSNATFLTTVRHEGTEVLAIYKPERGERRLWDFAPGLWRREVAAYELDSFLGWGLVPPTAPRQHGPLGRGSLQLYIDGVYAEHYFTLVKQNRHRRVLQKIAAFDLVANYADRKSGHLLLGEDARVWAIDHGLCFHVLPKLRTVIWDFAGQPLSPKLLAGLKLLAEGVMPETLVGLLAEAEIAALAQRAAAVVKSGVLPEPSGGSFLPWPLI